tara:strand:- start:571 stop:747 length:177 start_codon:yes stop_codon:yes gene_type:complete
MTPAVSVVVITVLVLTAMGCLTEILLLMHAGNAVEATTVWMRVVYVLVTILHVKIVLE